jgi:hypothetical protein
MARLCCVGALNAGAGTLREGASSEAQTARGSVSLEGGVSPRARRTLLERVLCWATLVGREGHRSVGCGVCVCFVLCSMCACVLFAGIKQDSPVFLTLVAVPDTVRFFFLN